MVSSQLGGTIRAIWSASPSGTEPTVSCLDDGHRRSGGMAVVGAETATEPALNRPSYESAAIAGGIAGSIGDMMMYSIDAVKTRQQGDPHLPPKYSSMGTSYRTIFREEGVRGLYGGAIPALVGSFSGTALFFGCYEWSKRAMISQGVNPSVAYLTAGFVADLAASPIYVPSEVLKSRLQLQGRFNNPHFYSGYNYRSFTDAVATIYRTEGIAAFFYGYRATLVRDLPFSALQFAVYEQERALAKRWMGSNDIGLGLEIATGASAGGIAGVVTCPLDVIKTRVQTQQNGPLQSTGSSTSHPGSAIRPSGLRTSAVTPLDASSVGTALKLIYRSEGIAGWFRGVGPRATWTSLQSGIMLVLYQALLRRFDRSGLEPDFDV